MPATTETRTIRRYSGMPVHRYRQFTGPALPDRQWPSRRLETAPLWCSVDLRDGNQALIEPMDLGRKHRMFELLTRMGFTEIEVGFPSASQIDFDFVRELIEHDLIPDDVTIQVITPARAELIERTFHAIHGAPRAIAHLYNSVSPLQRRVVFGGSREVIRAMTVQAAQLCTKLAEVHVGGVVQFEYSPESFSATEPDYALEICEAVMDVWQTEPRRPITLNLPATVECTTPNAFADQVEWMHRHLSRRDHVRLSVHPHNDRGTSVAAAELALLAGADRVEGCLFGNGERTGNVCLVTLGMNLFAHGIDPMLDLSDIDEIRRVAEDCTQLPVHPRHPYAGDLVYTAFSGSHQDAIKKGLDALTRSAHETGVSVGDVSWEVPYLPIDPRDVGRSYEAVIRLNSQSGKGGIAYLLKTEHRLDLPRRLQIEFSQVVQQHSENRTGEIDAAQLWTLFAQEYLSQGTRLRLTSHTADAVDVEFDERTHRLTANGAHSLAEALNQIDLDVRVLSLLAQPLGGDQHSVAAYAECAIAGITYWGVGVDQEESRAAMNAIASAINRADR